MQQRGTQLVQPRERQLGLGLDARRACDTTSRRALHEVLEQHRFADARLAPQDQRPALPGADRGEEPVERLDLATAAEQHTAQSTSYSS